jgi:CRP/FNR family transcriptional regulator, cyclic AMP receptor protein
MQPSKLWYIERFNLFKGILQQKDMEELARMSLMEKKSKGNYIYLPSDPADSLFLLKEGHVRISRIMEDGREVALTLLSPGEVFGEVALVDDSPRDHVAEAVDEVLLCHFRKRDFVQFLRTRPELTFKITKIIGLRLQRMETRVIDLICKDVITRIAELLLNMTERGDSATGRGDACKIALTHQDIASLVGVSRQTTTESLDMLKLRGLIDLGHRSIFVKDRTQLEAYVRSKTVARPST